MWYHVITNHGYGTLHSFNAEYGQWNTAEVYDALGQPYPWLDEDSGKMYQNPATGVWTSKAREDILNSQTKP